MQLLLLSVIVTLKVHVIIMSLVSAYHCYQRRAFPSLLLRRMRMKPMTMATSTIISPPFSSFSSSTSSNQASAAAVINHIFLPDSSPIAQCQRWIIFSDLHVRAASIDTCEQVLAAVHEQALVKQAGIIFLGDFWHVRGALSVDLLNRVLKSFQSWTQPVIMIPGNHDQVTLGGMVHALEPLRYAFDYDQMLLIDEPSICLNALWIPYRRSADLMRSILSQAWVGNGSSSSNSGNSISAIFCHADVKGAWMNDGIRSREGLDVSSFPPNIPVYSGHFHKPHIVSFSSNQRLRYVGSPYQTSLAEADEVKYLYQMNLLQARHDNSRVWEEGGQWPLDLGKKYFKIDSPSNNHDRIALARPGDRIVLSAMISELQSADQIARTLRDQGIEVEVRPIKDSSNQQLLFDKHKSTVMSSDDTSDDTSKGDSDNSMIGFDAVEPLTIFMRYLDSINATQAFSSSISTTATTDSNDSMNSEVIAVIRSKIMEEGALTLQRLASTNAKTEGLASAAASSNTIDRYKKLDLHHLTLKNFGPYGGSGGVDYPLGQRGLVLIRGQTIDNTGADSNGSGKTTLAMSILWALTGSMDTRLSSEGNRGIDVTHDSYIPIVSNNKRTSSKSKIAAATTAAAEVSLTGSINQQPFIITRRRSSKKHELSFLLNHIDLTQQSVKDTQAIIDDKLGLSKGLLQRCYFFGQHSHTAESLLGLTDTKLKEELGPLIDIDIWLAATSDVRARERVIKSQLTEMEILNKIKKEEKNSLDMALQAMNQTVETLQTKLNDTIEGRNKANQDMKQTVTGSPTTQTHSLNQMESQLRQLEVDRLHLMSTKIEPLRQEIFNLIASRNNNHDSYHDSNHDSNHDSYHDSYHQQQHSSSQLLETLQAKAAAIRANQAIAQTNLQSLTITIDQTLPAEISSLTNSMNHRLVESAPNPHKLAKLGFEKILSSTRTELELSIAALGSNDEKIMRANDNLNKLVKATRNIKQAVFIHDHGLSSDGMDNCPTCGQTLPLDEMPQRLTALQQELKQLLADRNQALTKRMTVQQQLIGLEAVKDMQNQLLTLETRREELQSERQQLVSLVASYNQEMNILQEKVTLLLKEKEEQALAYEEKIRSTQSQLQIAEADYNQLENQSRKLRLAIQSQRERLESLMISESQVNMTIALLESKLEMENRSRQERIDAISILQAKLDENEAKRILLKDQLQVLSHLSDLFGPKGVQHFIFQHVVMRLEQLANGYLEVLSEAGLVLKLRGDEDGEKITKSVLIRGGGGGSMISTSPDGSNSDHRVFKERALSQLSGGQWRRVSLAMDFAFSEYVVRRGLLRCNVLVLDEILTHLDAQGREAVGTALKMMVGHDISADTKSKVFNGYGTIIVILQDLVANEIEEAFDHIDIVRKQGDISTVILDE